MHEELKPCPFCGGKNIVVRKYTAVAGVHYYVQCDSANGGCGAEFESRISRKDAIKAWNKRVAEVGRCKECKYMKTIFPMKSKGEEAIEAHVCCLSHWSENSHGVSVWINDFCSYGERKE